MAIATSDRGRFRNDDDLYPVSDGKPMGETDKHIDLIIYCKEALKIHFADRPDVYIAGNNFLYFEEGNPKKCVSPDTYVVFGVAMRQRDCYMAWKEGGRLPAVVFEFTSKKTRQEDVHKKRPLYEQVLRVPEYFLFDPTGDYLRPRLQGFRLVQGSYVPILMLDDRLRSEQLNLDLVQDGEDLRFYDPQNQAWLLSPQEQAQRADAEARRAAEQTQRAAELARLAQEEAYRADTAERRAEAETQRADIEAQARAEAEAEIARLRAEIETLKRQ